MSFCFVMKIQMYFLFQGLIPVLFLSFIASALLVVILIKKQKLTTVTTDNSRLNSTNTLIHLCQADYVKSIKLSFTFWCNQGISSSQPASRWKLLCHTCLTQNPSQWRALWMTVFILAVVASSLASWFISYMVISCHLSLSGLIIQISNTCLRSPPSALCQIVFPSVFPWTWPPIILINILTWLWIGFDFWTDM